VAGVFVIVGLIVVAAVVSALFWFRQKLTARIPDHGAAATTTMAEHGYARQDFINGGGHHPVSDSGASTTTPSGYGGSADMMGPGSADMRGSGGADVVWWPNTANTTSGGIGAAPVSAGDAHGLADTLGQTYNPQPDYHAPQQNPFYVPQQDSFYTPQQDGYYAPQQGGHQAPQQGTYQAPQQHPIPGPSNPDGASGFGILPGRPFFGHGPKGSIGSSEPLLVVTSDNDSPPEYTSPAVPPRNPMRSMGVAGTRRYSDKGDSNDDASVYDDDDFEREALRQR